MIAGTRQASYHAHVIIELNEVVLCLVHELGERHDRLLGAGGRSCARWLMTS